MSRFTDWLTSELEIMDVVLDRHPRSAALFCLAVVAPVLMLMFFAPLLSQLAWPGLADAFRPVAGLISLAFMLQLMVLAVRTYLRDRARLLRF